LRAAHLGDANGVPPSGGSLEIGNAAGVTHPSLSFKFPLRGDP